MSDGNRWIACADEMSDGNRWIACADEMPDVDLMVLTYSPDSCEPVWPASFDGAAWVDDYGLPLAPPVTHWMNFPDPPEVEG